MTDGPTGTTPTNTTNPPDVAAESEAILGERPISVEALDHSRRGVMRGVWRVTTHRSSAIRKVVGLYLRRGTD